MLSRLTMTAPKAMNLASGVRYFAHSTIKSARYGGGGAGPQSGFGSRINQGFGVRSGPTLKERLLGPTTGKPFVYGTYALAGASVFGVGALMYYGLISKEQSILQKSAIWPSYVRERISSTYTYLAASIGLTAVSGVAASRSPALMRLTAGGGMLSLFGTMAVMIATGMLARTIDYDNTLVKHLAWALHCGVMGAVLAPLCFMGGPVLTRAAWYTAGIVGGLSATAITAPSEKFLMMSGPLAMGLGVVFMANIGTFFLPPGSALGASLASVVIYGGLILFSAFLLYDTQRLVKVAEMHPHKSMYGGAGDSLHIRSFDPINAQMSIYMDVLNIFIRLVMIMGGMSGNKRK
uniref:Growth hormone-inducible transmembrane protein n=1 Tax=Caenorhabditis tropicalis TaxID=1561998 RepID=A0A1I7UFL2_9PELO